MPRVRKQIEINVEWVTQRHLEIINAAKITPGEVTALEYQRSLEALAKLHGLNAPDRQEVTNKGGASGLKKVAP